MFWLAAPLVFAAESGLNFFPGASAKTLDYGEELARGAVLGKTGRVLVGWSDHAALLAMPGVATVRGLSGGVSVVSLLAPGDDLAFSRHLRAYPGVRWATPDLILPISTRTVPDDPWVGDEWHLENTGQGGRIVDVDINAELAWGWATGEGILIAVLDSGVQLDHPDLAVIAGRDYVDADDDPSPGTDSSGPHGTGAAGIAAATGNNAYGAAGVAFASEVYAIRLIGGNTSLSDLYESFVEAVDAGAGVLSNSWGFSGGCQGYAEYDSFREMYAYAEDYGRGGLGSVVVFAAGNDGCDIEEDGLLSTKKLIVVAALEWDDERASYSNFGKWVDIAAPTGLLTTDITPGGYGSYGDDDAFSDGFSGTSGATPVVAGVFALMFEANPRLTADQARDVLCQTATRNDVEHAGYNAEGWSPYYGCGRVDAGAAVAAVHNATPGAPVPILAEELPEAAAVIGWTAAEDADGDVLGYRLRWAAGNEAGTEDVYGLSYDLTGSVTGGQTVSWTVAAVDTWGEGAESAAQSVVIVPTPVDTGKPPALPVPDESEYLVQEQGSTCSSGAGVSGLAAVVVGLGGALRRRARGRILPREGPA